MKAIIHFHESSAVEPHTANLEMIPRQGDFLHIPELSTSGKFPVERVVFTLAAPEYGGAKLAVPMDSDAVQIYLRPVHADWPGLAARGGETMSPLHLPTHHHS